MALFILSLALLSVPAAAQDAEQQKLAEVFGEPVYEKDIQPPDATRDYAQQRMNDQDR